MTTTLENELREALATRAADLPSGASARLRCADYRPRAHGIAVPALGVGALAGAATVGTALSIVLGGAAPAYAGWSPAPTSVPTTPSPSAAASCQSQLSGLDSRPGAASVGSGPWESVLTDVRGPFTVALFQDDGAYAACFTSASFTELNMVSADGVSGAASGSGGGPTSLGLHAQTANGTPGSGGTSSVSVSGTASGDLQQVVQSHLTTGDGPYTLVDGRVGSGVTGVTLVRDDGQDVVATVADGWFVAWWPASATASSALVTTGSGTATEALLQAQGTRNAPPLPSSGLCTPGTTSGSASGPATSTGGSGERCSGGGNPAAGNSGNSGTAGNSGNSGNSGS